MMGYGDLPVSIHAHHPAAFGHRHGAIVSLINMYYYHHHLLLNISKGIPLLVFTHETKGLSETQVMGTARDRDSTAYKPH